MKIVATKLCEVKLDITVEYAIYVDIMYLDTSTSKQGGKTYTRHLLRESYREDGKVKHRTIANLSRCTPEEVEAIRFALKHKDKIADLGSVDDIDMSQGMRYGAVCFLKEIARRIHLTNVLGSHQNGKLALWQVFARLIDQGSRLSAVRLAENHSACDLMGIEAFNEEHLYANLTWLADNQEDIEKRLFKRRYNGHPPHLFLYDVTSSYLEGMENELADYGYNRDKKNGKKQIVIGLLTDDFGEPIAVRVFEGNTRDNKTVADQVRLLAESFGITDITLVGDRGMVKQAQIDMLEEDAFHYITAITKPQIEKLLRQGALQLSLFERTVCEVSVEGVRYILRRNPIRVEEAAQVRESKLNKLNAYLDEKNDYLAGHQRAKVETAIRNVQSKIDRLRISDWVSVETDGRSLELVIDEKAKKEKHRLDGCYVIKTDLTSHDADAQIIHDRYKDLSKVERAFRTFKTGYLEVRPIFVRKDLRTRGHVFVVMLAYLLEREIERCWREIETTVAEGIDELGSLRGVEMKISNVAVQKMPAPTGLCKELLEAADVKIPSVLPARKIHVATRKKLTSER